MDFRKVLLVIGLGAAASAQAQEFGVSAATQRVAVPSGYAAAGFQAPSGSGASLGSVGVGLYGQTTDRAGMSSDGSVGLNIGMGDPTNAIGFDASVSLSSLFGDEGGGDAFGEAGSVGAKLHRNLPGFVSVAMGVQSLAAWGDASDANTESYYVAATKFFLLNGSGISATLGAGNEAFSDKEDGIGAIGSVAYYFRSNISLIGEYTGRFANVAVSVAPVRTWPMTLTLGAVNLGDRFDLGTQFAASIGAGFGL